MSFPTQKNNVKGHHGLRDLNGVENRGEADCCCYKHTYTPEQDESPGAESLLLSAEFILILFASTFMYYESDSY